MTGRLIVPAVTAVALLVAGCGGRDSGTPSESAAKAAASASAGAESRRRTVTASVDGRTLSGHCSGAQQGGSPAVLLESGAGGGQDQLSSMEEALAGRTLVCSYDRAGTGQSDPPRGAGADNPERTSFLEPTLNRSLPSTMPYAVMYDNDCDPGTDDFCRRILAPELRTARALAAVGDRGRFVRAKGAGHDIFASDPELVHKTISDVLNDTP